MSVNDRHKDRMTKTRRMLTGYPTPKHVHPHADTLLRCGSEYVTPVQVGGKLLDYLGYDCRGRGDEGWKLEFCSPQVASL